MIEVRTATVEDVGALAALLDAYMRETFRVPWQGSVERLAQALGRDVEIFVAIAAGGAIVAFAAFRDSYDLHHCVRGAEVIDLYVRPEHRARLVAVRLLAAVAGEVTRRGGGYIKGQSVDDPAAQRLYQRFAVCFPGADCYLAGRALRAVAALAGRAPREIARNLPDKAWNREP